MEFLVKLTVQLIGIAVLTVAIKGVVALFEHSIAWWLAALIAAVLVWGGVLILSGSDWDAGWD